VKTYNLEMQGEGELCFQKDLWTPEERPSIAQASRPWPLHGPRETHRWPSRGSPSLSCSFSPANLALRDWFSSLDTSTACEQVGSWAQPTTTYGYSWPTKDSDPRSGTQHGVPCRNLCDPPPSHAPCRDRNCVRFYNA
jgi:hypothetical protein